MRKYFVILFILLLSTSCFGLEIVRQKNVATYISFPLSDADGNKSGEAGSADSEIDGWSDGSAPGNFIDCTNEVIEEGSTGWYYLLLTQTEMNEDYLRIKIITSNTFQNILIRTIVGDPLLLATTDDGGEINVTAGAVDVVVTISGNVDGSVDSVTGDTKQTGDSYAIVNNGTYGNSALRTRGDIAWITGGGTGLTPLASGTAQSGSGTAIVLAASSAHPTNDLNGSVVNIISGTGLGQSRLIISNTLGDDTCVVSPAWNTSLGADSGYEIVEGTVNIQTVLLTVPWDASSDTVLLTDGTGAGEIDLNAGAVVSVLTASAVSGDVGGDVQGNVDGTVATVTNPVTVGTNNDKTGYSLAADQSGVTIGIVNDFAADALTAAATATDFLAQNIGINWADVSNPGTALDLSGTDIQLVDTVTTYTGNTPQTADHTAGIADIPTVAEFNARTLLASAYFDFTIDTTNSNCFQLGGDSQSLNDLKDFADAGYDPATDKVQGVVLNDTTTTNTDMRGTDSAALASGVNMTQINGTSITGTGSQVAAGFEHYYNVATPNKTINDTGVAGSGLTAQEIWEYNISAIVTAGLAGDYLNGLTPARAGYLDNLNGHTPQSGDSFIRLGAPSGASISADIAALKTVADLLQDEAVADSFIDTTTDPWEWVVHESGNAANEFFRKRLFDVDGTSLTSILTPIGRSLE